MIAAIADPVERTRMIRRSRTVVGIFIVLMLTLVQNAAAQQDNAVIAIDIALEPGQAMEDRAHAANAVLLADFPKGFPLDATHHAHVTLLQCYVRTADLDKVYAAANGVLAKEDVAHWKLRATRYSSLILGPIGGVVIDVEATPDLVRLQRELIEAVAPFTVKTGTTAAFYTTPDEPDIIPFSSTTSPPTYPNRAATTSILMSPLASPTRISPRQWPLDRSSRSLSRPTQPRSINSGTTERLASYSRPWIRGHAALNGGLAWRGWTD